MIMGHLEKLLQAAMDKHEKFEREKVNLQRNLAQKEDLYEDAMKMMHSIRMQHDEMIEAHLERICFLEGDIEPAQKDAQRGREIVEGLEKQTAECSDLQDALAELEQEMKFGVSSARAEMERKFEPEMKGLKEELQVLKDEHAIETAAFEK
jgi:chromosome segregation ATPase